MTLQGFLKADEYGMSTSMVGGISLTMSAWGEKAKGLVGMGPRYVPLPQALVAAALQETARHPGIQAAPQLKAALVQEQHIWRGFRDKQIGWMLQHSSLVGALQSDPTGRDTWSQWYSVLNMTEQLLAQQRAALCMVGVGRPQCVNATAAVAQGELRVQQIRQIIHVWTDVLQMQPVRAGLWWRVTQNTSTLDASFDHYAAAAARLHNVSWVRDERITTLLEDTQRFAQSGLTTSVWIQRVLASLMEGEIWAACLEHVRQRESRIREMMMATGVQELYNAHERILNASLRVVSTGPEQRTILDWFAEMSANAWWMGDDLPAVVRRCIGTENGDCRRIGPSEITAMTAHMGAATAVLEDWSRRLFIGMWNGLPALGLLFLVECTVMCLHLRGTPNFTKATHDPQVMVLRLESSAGQIRDIPLRRRNQPRLTDNRPIGNE